MTKYQAEYYAELLTTVTYDDYIAELSPLGDHAYVIRIASNGKKEIQPNGNIRVALENAARQCRNGLAQL